MPTRKRRIAKEAKELIAARKRLDRATVKAGEVVLPRKGDKVLFLCTGRVLGVDDAGMVNVASGGTTLSAVKFNAIASPPLDKRKHGLWWCRPL